MTTDTPVGAPPRRVEYMRLDDIPPATRNAKAHDIDALVTSIRTFGFTSPGLLDERTGRMVAGHGRCEALTRLRDWLQDPPEGVLVDEDGEWRAPVVRGWASENDTHADAYTVADNRHAELGGWVDPLLAEILQDVSVEPGLLEAAGYTPDDLAALLAEATSTSPPEEFPAFDDETIATEHECPRCHFRWSGKAGA